MTSFMCVTSTRNLLVSLGICFVLIGCGSFGNAKQAVEKPFAVDARSLMLAVDVVPPSYGMEPNVSDEFLGEIIARLRQTGKFKNVVAKRHDRDSRADLRLVVSFTSAREVSASLRASVGFWAGDSTFVADVQAYDNRSGAELSKSAIAVTTGGKATSSDSVELFASEVVKFMEGGK